MTAFRCLNRFFTLIADGWAEAGGRTAAAALAGVAASAGAGFRGFIGGGLGWIGALIHGRDGDAAGEEEPVRRVVGERPATDHHRVREKGGWIWRQRFASGRLREDERRRAW